MKQIASPGETKPSVSLPGKREPSVSGFLLLEKYQGGRHKEPRDCSLGRNDT